MSFWPYMKIKPHYGKFYIMDYWSTSHPTKKQKLSTSQIFDDIDIDEKSLRGYVKDGRQMNPTLHLITCVW